jgi:chromosome segregation ATPase
MNDTYLIGIICAAIGSLATVAVAYLNRDKTAAEARQKDAETASTLLSSAVEVAKQLGDLSRQADEREKLLNDTRAELRKAHDEREDTLDRLQKLENQDKERGKQMAALQEEIDRLKGENETKDARIGDLEKQLADSLETQKADRATIEGLQATIAAQDETISQLSGKLEKAETDRKRLESEMATLQGEKDDTVEIRQETVQAARDSQHINPAAVLTGDFVKEQVAAATETTGGSS